MPYFKLQTSAHIMSEVININHIQLKPHTGTRKKERKKKKPHTGHLSHR